MRIAQIAPLYERVPPHTYGGTERVVSYLTEELVKQGHDVTLFASGDSITASRLVACCPRSLRLDTECVDSLAWHYIQMETVARLAEDFDILHYHTDYLHFPISSRTNARHVTTLHGRLDLPELPFVHRVFPAMPLISISDSQRAPLPDLHWRATVHHGLPESLLEERDERGEHLTLVGRISPEKGIERAIELAKRVEIPLVVAAKVDRIDQEYFDTKIKKLLDHPLISYVGEVDEDGKRELFRRSIALTFLIDWPEPFGLVMIEAMACGVPVIAWRCGSVPEVIEHGRTGYIVGSMEEAVEAVKGISAISRDECRKGFLARFTAVRMASNYVAEYERMLESTVTLPAAMESSRANQYGTS